MQPRNMELNRLMQYIREMKKKRGFDVTSLEQEFLLFSEEVGEVASALWPVIQSEDRDDEELKRTLGFEIVDCLIYLLSIANMAGIEDIESLLMEKEAINTRRFEGQ